VCVCARARPRAHAFLPFSTSELTDRFSEVFVRILSYERPSSHLLISYLCNNSTVYAQINEAGYTLAQGSEMKYGTVCYGTFEKCADFDTANLCQFYRCICQINILYLPLWYLHH
jgi:hypothetical protein